MLSRSGSPRAGGRPVARTLVVLLAVGAALAGACSAPPDPPPRPGGVESVPAPLPPSTNAPVVLGVEFPGADTTGVPDGVELTPYTGPCQITADDTVIEAKTVDCALDVRAANVVIVNSVLNGPVGLDTDLPGAEGWSMTLQDSEVDGGTTQIAAVGWGNMTIVRADVHGGQTGVQCFRSARYCTVRDSWLHGQHIPADEDWHLGGFLSNGGTNIELTGNTIACDARPTSVDGGCTGNLNLLPDFAPISHATIEGNFLRANTGSSFCTYGGDSTSKPFPDADHVVYRDNVFERGTNGQCAAYGPVTDFDRNGVGNEWTNNRWDDGSTVPPQ